MALYRGIAGIGSGVNPLHRVASAEPEVWNDTDLPDHVFDAIGCMLRGGMLRMNGTLTHKFPVGAEQTDALRIFNAHYGYGNQVSGLFDKILQGIAAVSMAVPRNAFLGLVGINAFGYATKLQKALAIPEAKDKMVSIWEHFGGQFSKLQGTINHGAKSNALLKISNGKFVSGATVGLAPVAAAALIAAASSIVVALMPIISKILDKNKVNVTYPGIDPITGLPIDGSAGVSTGTAMDFLRSPVVLAAGIALGIYYLMD